METMLPKEQRFDTALVEVREMFVDVAWGVKEDLQDIIDPKQEFSRPYLELWNLSAFLSGVLKLEGEDPEEVRVAVYRAMAFGFQVVHDVRCLPMETLSMSYLTEVFNNDDPADTLRAEVEDYLDERDELSSLLYTFKPEIDKTYNYWHHVETSAGLVLMLCERQQAEIYLKRQADELDDEAV